MKKILILCFSVLILTSLVACSEKDTQMGIETQPIEVDMNEYVSVEFDEITYQMFTIVDFESIYQVMRDKNDVLFESILRTSGEFDQYINANALLPNTAENGDIAIIQWDVDEEFIKMIESNLGVRLLHNNEDFVVEGLPDVIEINPFNYLRADTHGTYDGNGELDVYVDANIKGVRLQFEVEHDGVNGQLSNATMLNMKLKNPDECVAFAEKYRIKLTCVESEVEVYCFTNVVKGDTLFSYITSWQIQAFDQVFNDWVMSGLNDSRGNAERRVRELVGFMFYSNDDDTNDANGALVAIYRVKEQSGPEHYLFFGLEGCFSEREYQLFYNGQEKFPTHFVEYDKEKVRYDDKYGWLENTQEMGFINEEGLAYAGHQTFQETIEYLNALYGDKYHDLHLDKQVQKLLQ